MNNHAATVEILKENDVRVTPQRLAVVDYLEENHIHPSAEMIFQAIKPRFPSLSLATVYNTLDVLERAGKVLKISIAGNPKVYFEYNTDFHCHFYCKKCFKLYDIFIEYPYEYLKVIEDHKIEETNIHFKGTCKDCINNSTSTDLQ